MTGSPLQSPTMPILTANRKNTFDLKQFIFARCPSCHERMVWRHGKAPHKFFGSCCLWTIEARPTDSRVLYFDIYVKKISPERLGFIVPRIRRRTAPPTP